MEKQRTINKMTTEQILHRVTNVKQGVDEERQVYLVRLANIAYKKVSDKQYENFPEKVQEWMDYAVEAIDNKEPVLDFPEVTAKSDIINEVKPKEDVMKTSKTATKKVVKRTAGTAAKKVTKKATVTKAKAAHLKAVTKPVKVAKAKAPKKVSVVRQIRELTCKHPAASVEDIRGMLTKAGLECAESTLRTQFRDTHMIMDVMGDLGKLNA